MRPLWIEVRHPTTRRLMYRYDPIHERIECKPDKLRFPCVTDLTLLKAEYAEQIEQIMTGATGEPERPDRRD